MVPTRRLVSRFALYRFVTLYTFIILANSLGLFGCAYARVERALVNRQPVNSGRLAGIKITRANDQGEKQEIRPRVKMDLKEGDIIETDDSTHLVIHFPSKKAQVIVYPNTKLTISSIFVDFGTILVEIFVESKEKLEVESKYARMKTRGTAYKLAAPTPEDVTITVLNGVVEVVSKEASGSARVTAFQRFRIVGSSLGRGRTEKLAESEKTELIREFNELGSLVGNKKAIVPECVGVPIGQARQRVADAELAADVDERLTENRDQVDLVLAQQPDPGEYQDRGDDVRLTVGVLGVRVPKVEGLQVGEARQQLRASDLHLSVRDAKITGRVPPDTILQQQPAPGQLVRVGTALDVVVEAESVKVPDVCSMRLDKAESLLKGEDLRLQVARREITGRYRYDRIISQDPRPGTLVEPGTVVAVVVEAKSVKVPDLNGMQFQQAAEGLLRRDLHLQVRRREITGRFDAGAIISQDPRPGTLVEPGSEIGVVVEGESVVMPGVVGEDVRRARSILSRSGLENVRFDPRLLRRGRAGEVLDQQPRAGTRVAPGEQVRLTVARIGKVVPNVEGTTYGAARRIARESGFSVSVQAPDGRPNPADVVESQSPGAGELVDPANAVIEISIRKTVME